jgi:hypothetical protein
VALILGPVALLLLVAGARNLWWAVAGPPRPRAPMSEAQARAVAFEELAVRADGAWRVVMAGDPAPAVLLRAGDRCVFVRGGAVADLLADAAGEDEGEGEEASVPGELTVVSRAGRLWRVEDRGVRVPLGEVLVAERAPRRGLAWWQHGVLEFGVADLPEGVRAQLERRPGPGSN